MKNQGIKMLLLDVAEIIKRIAMELGEEKEDVKEEKKEVKDEKPEIEYLDVRKLCSDKAKDHHNEEVKEIIRSYGVQTLSEIDSKYYEEIMERVNKL